MEQIISKYLDDVKSIFNIDININDFNDKVVNIKNDFKNINKEVELSNLLKTFYNIKPIITGSDSFYANSEKETNVVSIILNELLTARKKAKKEMFGKDGEEAKKLDIIQKSYKILANSVYGAFGQNAFQFYNKDLGPSVTLTGQMLITTAIMAFESLLGRNYMFYNSYEVLHYYKNIISEPIKNYKTKNNIHGKNSMVHNGQFCHSTFHNRAIYPLTYKLINKSFNDDLLENQLHNFFSKELKNRDDCEQQLLRLHYKNNLHDFLEDADGYIPDELKNFDVGLFVDPNEIPIDMKPYMDYLLELLEYFVFYTYPHENCKQKCITMQRDVIIVSDTDSTFLYLKPTMDKITEMLNNGFTKNTASNKDIPISNIVIWFCTKYIDACLRKLNVNLNVLPKDFSLINMKSEFYMDRVLVTRNKKSYAGSVLRQESKLFKEPELDIKGIKVKTVSTPKPAQIFFKNILNEIMFKEKIEPVVILNKFVQYQKEIRSSLQNGEVTYLDRGKANKPSTYKEPYTIEAFRAVRTWNLMYPENEINYGSNIKILKLKGKEDSLKALLHKAFIVDSRLFEYNLAIALPLNLNKIPNEFINFIDYNTIIDKVMNNGNIILESLGFVTLTSYDVTTISNVVRL